jgi:predicted DNA-binding protein
MRRRRNAPQPTSIRLPKDLRKRLEKRAEQHGSFLSVYIIWTLTQAMDRLDRGERPLPQFEPQE